MLNFRPMQSDDYSTAEPIMRKSGCISTDANFVALYMWSKYYNTKICITENNVFLRVETEKGNAYIYPHGDDFKVALLKILETEGDGEVHFISIPEKIKEKIENVFPGEFTFTEKRSSFDYVYKREALATLPGRKLHQKRTNINKFLSKYEGRYTYESLKKDDAEEILAFQKKWFDDASSKDGKETLDYETSAIAELFENFDKFNLRGGILRVDGDIAAYCIASKINDTALDIMVEKASGEYIGAYQMINKLFAENGCGDIEYINREEDMGIEGLRRAKLSYCPELLIKKYGAIWKR